MYHFTGFTCVFFVHFLSELDKSTPVSGSSSMPSGVIFLGKGVKVDSGLSIVGLIKILKIPKRAIIT
jgi:hypothetical protein